jgi:hypothetical protein
MTAVKPLPILCVVWCALQLQAMASSNQSRSKALLRPAAAPQQLLAVLVLLLACTSSVNAGFGGILGGVAGRAVSAAEGDAPSTALSVLLACGVAVLLSLAHNWS